MNIVIKMMDKMPSSAVTSFHFKCLKKELNACVQVRLDTKINLSRIYCDSCLL